jgi:hypothetical protein
MNVSSLTQFSSFRTLNAAARSIFGEAPAAQRLQEMEIRRLDDVLETLPVKPGSGRTYRKLGTQGRDLEVLTGAHGVPGRVIALQTRGRRAGCGAAEGRQRPGSLTADTCCCGTAACGQQLTVVSTARAPGDKIPRVMASYLRGKASAGKVIPLRRRLLCRCGHDRDAHRHYRPGSDCALCECRRWCPRRWRR